MHTHSLLTKNTHIHPHTYTGTVKMVCVPKERKTFCKGKKCNAHRVHKVTQYKAGKASNYAQVRREENEKEMDRCVYVLRGAGGGGGGLEEDNDRGAAAVSTLVAWWCSCSKKEAYYI